MLSLDPEKKLSMQTTSAPSPIRRSQRWDAQETGPARDENAFHRAPRFVDSVGHEEDALFHENVPLDLDDLGDPLVRELHQAGEVLPGEGILLRRGLDLDELPSVGLDDVHVESAVESSL